MVGAELLRTIPSFVLLLIVHDVHAGELLVSHIPYLLPSKVQSLKVGFELCNQTPSVVAKLKEQWLMVGWLVLRKRRLDSLSPLPAFSMVVYCMVEAKPLLSLAS